MSRLQVDAAALAPFIQFASDGIAIHRDGVVLAANDAWLRIAGRNDISQVAGCNLSDFIARESLRHVMRPPPAPAASPAPVTVITAGGERLALEAVTLGIEAGGSPAVMVMLRARRDEDEVTERRDLREQLRRALQQLRLVFDSIPTPVAYVDSEARYRFASSAYEPWMGVSPSLFEGKRVEDVLGPREYAKLAPLVARTLAGEAVSFELELTFPALGRRLVRGSFLPHVGADGIVHGYVSLLADETDRRRNEQASELIAASGALLSESLDYQTTIRSIASAVIPRLADHCIIDVLEPDGTLQRLAVESRDPRMRRVVGDLRERVPSYGPLDPRAQALETSQSLLLPEVDRALLERFAANEEHLALIEQLNPTSAIVTPLRTGPDVLGILLLVATHHSRTYDEVDRQTAEEIARRASAAITNARLFRQTQEVAAALSQANAAKDEFLALVSHELRTPLTTIAGNADVLSRAADLLSEAQRQQALFDIKRDSDRLRALVENMLILSRVGQGEMEMEPMIAPRVIEELVHTYRARHPSRRFQVRLPARPAVVLAERTCLEHIIENLLANATKYSPDASAVEIRFERRGQMLHTIVADRGFGISDDEPLFEPFYRSRIAAISAPGLGLGLTVCKRLVEVQGGEIWARPRSGGGAEFAFSLPLHGKVAD